MATMNRDDARQYIIDHLDCRKYLKKAKKGGYICIYCGSGTHNNQTGAVKYYESTNLCACHACPPPGQKAHKFNVLDLIQHEYNCDYNTALQIGADELGITIETRADRIDRIAKEYIQSRKTAATDAAEPPKNDSADVIDDKTEKEPAAPQDDAQNAAEAVTDYFEYYKQCRERRKADPAAVSYLQARGISQEIADKYFVGYDPAWISPAAAKARQEKGDNRPLPKTARFIIPVSHNYYVARDMNPNAAIRYMNEDGGGDVGIFNYKAVTDAETVFVTEGAFDALSYIEIGQTAIGLNSTSNAGILIDKVKANKPAATFILSLDNDEKGKKATETLKTAFDELGVRYIVSNVSAEYKDANDALRGDRESFKAGAEMAVKAAAEVAKQEEQREVEALPGILTYSAAVNIFETADNETIELKSFPTFSKTARIKKHDSIVIAADTGGGKSSLAINFMHDLSENYPCIYINLEMDTIDVLQRLVAIQSGLEIDRIQGYQNDEQTAAAVNIALQSITSREPIQIIQGAYMLEDVQDIIEKSIKGREKPTAVFIDHSLLMDTRQGASGRYDRFTQLSEGLRKMALKYNIILFVLLQQNRAGKAIEEERPKNSSLKESGSWENDSTQICFLWYDPAERRKKLLLTKNRHGNIGEFPLNYWKNTQTYTEASNANRAAGTVAKEVNRPVISRRDKQREKLEQAYTVAYTMTNGKPTLRAIAEAADVATSTVKGWIKEYGGCTVDGVQQDPAGIDTEVEYHGFIKLTATEENPMEEDGQSAANATPLKAGKRR